MASQQELEEYLAISKDLHLRISAPHTQRSHQYDDEIVELCGSIKAKLDLSSPIDDKSEHPPPSLNLSRNTVFSTQFQVKRESLVRLFRMYEADHMLAKALSASIEKDCEVQIPNLASRPLMMNALREMIVESTDDVTIDLGLVAKPGVRLAQGLLTMSTEADETLQRFGEIFEAPNLAEVQMLSCALRIPEGCVLAWFVWRWERKRRLYVVERLSTVDNKMGAVMRIMDHLQRASKEARPTMTEELKEII